MRCAIRRRFGNAEFEEDVCVCLMVVPPKGLGMSFANMMIISLVWQGAIAGICLEKTHRYLDICRSE